MPARRSRRFTLALVLACLIPPVQSRAEAPTSRPVDASQIKVPDGFVVERVAGPPLVDYPMMAGFDERGRLFVAENAGVNLPYAELLKNPPSKVVMLEDTNADGAFDKRTVFADKLTFPSGALWHRGALYVTSPPGLWKFEDTDNDGVADKRTQIVTGFNSTGNAADLHGPFLGPEGWLYFTNGRNGHDLTLGDGTKWTGKAACLYRCRPDGSGLEVVFGGGFDNPVEVAFTAEGEPLVNVNILHAQPQRVDAIVYGIEGGNYPHDNAWRELTRTGDFLPAAGELGWVATSGFMRYRGRSLGPKLNGRYFSTEFNTRRVRAHVVERDGAGFKISHEDFLTCENSDFHPTDVLEDADGSLLVIDTGAWFRIGCPASKVAKPEVTGAIYRIRRADADDPSHPGAAPSPHMATDARLAATRLVGLRGGADAGSKLLARISDPNPAVRREAASGLGRLRLAAGAGPLLAAAAGADGDRCLEHAITYALIRISDRDATLAGLRHASPAARRAALVALDQMPGGGLTADRVAPHLVSDDARLREAALAVATSHPDWAEQIVPTLRAALTTGEVAEKDAAGLRAALVAFAKSPPMQAMLPELLIAESTSTSARLVLLQAVAGAGVTPLPESWTAALRASLAARDETVLRHTVEAVRATGTAALDVDLLKLARDAKRPADLRVAALSATLPRATSVDSADFQLLLGELSAKREPLARLASAHALAAAPLDDAQLGQIARAIASAGPLELPALLPAFERSANPDVGAALVESLKSAKSLAGLTPSALAKALAKYPQGVRDDAAPLLAKINPSAGEQQARLAELQPLLTGGDAGRGRAVFFGKTSACATCHAVGGQGASVGPDLTKIASIRSGRDLLESVVFPSNSFARGYESFVVQTKSNQLHAGVLAGETPDAIVLRTPAEVRIPRSGVKSMRQDRVSIMPQGLETQLSREELADLLAFLQSLK